MKRLIFILSVFLFISINLFSQHERVNFNCNKYTIERFSRENPGIPEVMFATENVVNQSEAYLIGWGSFTEVIGLSTWPVGLIGEVFEPKALENANKVIGHVGEGIALLQLSIDIYNGDYNQGAMNFTKSGVFWAVGKFGWKSLKVASFGIQLIDYSLNEFGKAGVKARTDSWGQAYIDYYKDKGGGNLNIAAWKTKFEKATTKEEVEKIIDAHVKQFWSAEFMESYVSKRTLLGYIGAEPHPKEKKAIEDAYKTNYLYPYIKPIFLRMSESNRQKQLDALCLDYKKLANWANASHVLRARLINRTEICEGAQASLVYTIDGVQKVFMLNSEADGYGEFFFKFTRYSLLLKKIKDASIVIKCKGPKGVKTFSQEVELGKINSIIEYSFPKEPDIDSLELIRADSLRRDSVLKDSIRRDLLLKDSIAKDVIVKDSTTVEEIFELNDDKVNVPDINFKDHMSAVFTIMKNPLKVEAKKIKETATHYHGLIVSGTFFKQNELIVNKVTGELSIIYKLKGKRAPELICKSSEPILGVYSGRIITNNVHAVDVGYFTFKFKD